MPTIGPMEIAVVLIVALVILGPKRLPQAGRSLGEGMRGFKESLTGTGTPEPALIAEEPDPPREPARAEA